MLPIIIIIIIIIIINNNLFLDHSFLRHSVRTVAMIVLLHTDVDMFVVFPHITYYVPSSISY
jgi:hypothetical protein